MSQLLTDLETLPDLPGAYLMKDSSGEVLYVGKAARLKTRVRQYFNRAGTGDGRFHIGFLIPRIQDVEVVVTLSEREALILENTLIKKYQPRYNVQLKDDKTWMSLRLPTSDRWPRPTLVRRWKDDGAKYYGPYLDEVNARKVLKLLTRTAGLRTCSDSVFRSHSERPCIEHAIGRCSAPCAGYIDEQGYSKRVEEARLLLEGRNRSVVQRLKARMERASQALRFEEAARLRDSVKLLERIAEKQSADTTSRKDRDVFGLHREGELAAVALVPIREGLMQDARSFTFRGAIEEDAELLGRVITQLYNSSLQPPPEILVPCPVDSGELRQELLGEIAGRKVRIRAPQRGEARRLVETATTNAQVRFASAHSRTQLAQAALFGLQKVLRLPHLPRRIECYDNSNTQGTDPVGAMVTFTDGRPDKSGYRIFGIKTVEGADDYATMREVFRRRLEHARKGEEAWRLSDLVVVDGGRGQLNMAVAACQEAGFDVIGLDGSVIAPQVGGPALRVISIAKPREDEETDKIYEPGRSNPLGLRPRDAALRLLQQLRDEAHRFGVHHHRKRRKKRTVRSALDDVTGIGPVLRTRLLKHFGSFKSLLAADLEEIAAVPGVGQTKAQAIKAVADKGKSR